MSQIVRSIFHRLDCIYVNQSLRIASDPFDKSPTHRNRPMHPHTSLNPNQQHNHPPPHPADQLLPTAERSDERCPLNRFASTRRFYQLPQRFDSYHMTTSPVSHRIHNKRVAQIEASEFLSLSNNGRPGDDLNDTYGLEEYGLEEEEEENEGDIMYQNHMGFNRSYLYHNQHKGSGAYRSPRRVHSKSFSGPYNRRGSAPVAPLSISTGGAVAASTATAATATSATDRTRKTYVSRNGGRKRNLLNFILELLTTRQTCVEWVDKPKQVFQIVNPEQLTKLWGEHKNNIKMSFESLSRSLR